MQIRKQSKLLLWLTIASLSALAAYQNADFLRDSAQRLGLLVSQPQGQLGAPPTRATAPVVDAAQSVQRTFSLETVLSGPGTVFVVEIGDMTGDGRDDLVVVVAGDYYPDWVDPHVLILVQLPNGTLAEPLRLEFPEIYKFEPFMNSALGDLNEDGRKDLVLTPGYQGGVLYLVSEPGGGFGWRSDLWNRQPSSENSLLVTDSNRDGHLDVMTHVKSWDAPYDSQFLFYYGNGFGEFSNHRGVASEELWLAEMAVGDLNSDTVPDLVTVSKPSVNPTFNGLIVRNHAGAEGYSPPQFHYTNWIQQYSATAIADMNGDGRNDLAAVANVKKDVLVFLQTAGNTLSPTPIVLTQGSTASMSQSMLATDLNNDGRQDLAYVVSYWGYFFYNLQGPDRIDTVASIDMPVNVPGGRDTIAMGDLNGDGVKDLAIAGYYDGWVVMHGKLTTYTGSGTIPGAPQMGSATIDPATYRGSDGQLVNVDVTFSPPTSNGGNAITGYTVHSVPSGARDYFEGSLNTVHKLENLKNDTTYRFYVTATNQAGISTDSALSNPVTVRDFPNMHPSDNVVLYEGNGSLQTKTLTLNLDNPVLSGGASFRVTTASGTALAGSDFVAFDKTVTIPQGARSVDFELVMIGDSSVEPTEEFVVNFSELVGIQPTTFTRSTIRVYDDDPAATNPAVWAEDDFADEGNSGGHPMPFDIVLYAPLDHDVTFDLATAPNSAQEGVDYIGKTWLGARIAAGQTKATLELTIIGDSIVEPDEFLNLKFSNVVGAAAVRDGTLLIRNDDLSPLRLESAGVVEGDSGVSKAKFTASRDVISADKTTFTAETLEGSGTAVAGSDYLARQITGLAIPAGELSTEFSIDVLGDTKLEANETFLVGLKNVVAATPGAPAQATIFNDDVSNSLAIKDLSVTEGANGTKLAVFSIVLSEPAVAPVTFDIATEPGTASPESDYGSRTVVGQTIAAGQDSATFSVTIKGDELVEGHETFTVNLRNVSGANLSDGQAAGRILNDDVAYLFIEDLQVVEGNGDLLHSVFFRVRLSQPSTLPVRFDISSDMRGPTYYTDYMARQRDITIDPGRTQALYEVQIRGDTLVEESETFNVLVFHVMNAEAVKNVAVGTIIDDDVAASPGTSKAAAKGKAGRISSSRSH